MAKLNKIKTSLLSRSLSIAKLGINAGIKYAGSKITQQNSDDMLISQAQLITGQLGELKGSLMKAGQMLSMYGEYFFPPQANQILKTLQSESPAIEWNVMQGYLKNYIGEELFNELIIDPEPIGCASLGQVHKAQIKTSQKWIALKIQYPDLDKAIDSDIKALKTILKI